MVSLQFAWQSYKCHFYRFISGAFRNLISPDFSLRKMNTFSDANKVQRPWKHERPLCTVFANRVHVTATVQNVTVWASGSLMFEQRGHAQLLSLCHSEACRENKSTTEQNWHLASTSLFTGFLWPINTRCDSDISPLWLKRASVSSCTQKYVCLAKFIIIIIFESTNISKINFCQLMNQLLVWALVRFVFFVIVQTS